MLWHFTVKFSLHKKEMISPTPLKILQKNWYCQASPIDKRLLPSFERRKRQWVGGGWALCAGVSERWVELTRNECIWYGHPFQLLEYQMW